MFIGECTLIHFKIFQMIALSNRVAIWIFHFLPVLKISSINYSFVF